MGIELSSHVNFQGICIGADHVSENDILVFILKKKKKKKRKEKKRKQNEAVQAEKWNASSLQARQRFSFQFYRSVSF